MNFHESRPMGGIDPAELFVFSGRMKLLPVLCGGLFFLTPASAQLRCLESEATIEVRNGDALVMRYHKQPS